MPTYDYKCKNCEKVFETFHGISENPQIFCPSCGSQARKIVSLHSGLIFKGSGFYITDYKKSTTTSESKSESK